MDKTPVTVLQELMSKYLQVPSYEFVAQTGPQHLSVFEYRCTTHGVTAHGVARSKKEAKQEAARYALAALAAYGLPVPPPYRLAPELPAAVTPPSACRTPQLPSTSEEASGGESRAAPRLGTRSYVALLKELCEEFRLGAVTYELVGDAGPPHLRMFTVRATLASHERTATASTKKGARQMAAEQLYTYLRQNLACVTRNFVEALLNDRSEKCGGNDAVKECSRKRTNDEAPVEVQSKRLCDVNRLKNETIVKEDDDAFSRALAKAMSRYLESREEPAWRPDLSHLIANYHLGVFAHTNEEQRAAAEKEAAVESEDAGEVLEQTAATLGMTVKMTTVPADHGALTVVSLGPATPELTLAGRDPLAAERAALRYLRRVLQQRPDPSDLAVSATLSAPTTDTYTKQS